jgi:Polyketide cyclase / dehydrase and lipid transport
MTVLTTAMLKKVAIASSVLFALLLGLILSRPGEFVVERTKLLAAPPEAVFARVNSFGQWSAWSPWEGLDPAMKKTYDGPAAGVGAHYAWDSANSDAGQGEMTIKDSSPTRIAIDLHFIRPFEGSNDTVFTMTPKDGGTEVNWRMSGKNDFAGKAFSLFMDMDKLVGGDFEKGLASLETAAKADAAAAGAATGAALQRAMGGAAAPSLGGGTLKF